MKINECSVIDNKVIDELMAESMHFAVYEVLEYIKQHSKPLGPIVRDVWDAKLDFNTYLNETEI